ncbi:hypothetical protein DU19_0706 [Chlamydia muridarum]|nr:hypothetical protein DU17_0708 [Chlamydia muridarum]KDU81656.1 hypothetical protein DU18_0706 [Chlamydia muridarum]KDU82092.1 hypothetical protein DU19_0706 [Chlamydia muridarum]KDU83612.1 hypothetical protein DU20_0707 [Chlamydia muridarum]KDU84135.1 hypothetical protein DU21_0708 [Chlamydia muridarum]
MFLFILELFPNLYYTPAVSFKDWLLKEDPLVSRERRLELLTVL